MTSIDLQTLTERAGGVLFSGSINDVIRGAAPIADAENGDVTLLDHEKNLAKLSASRASACVTSQNFSGVQISQIVVENPHEAFKYICQLFRPPIVEEKIGVDPLASIADSAQISDLATIGPFTRVAEDCLVGAGTRLHSSVTIMRGCQIGKDCELFPGVVLYPGTILEDRVVLHSGTVLGANGFGYQMENGKHAPAAQLGWVHVESDVEIGANSCVDRGTYGSTRIGEGTKIDNLVQIAHNCKIGKHNLICSQTGIAGSSSTGEYVVIAGQVGVRDHVTIGDRTMVGAQSGIVADTGADQILLGSPAIPRMEQAVIFASVNRLPALRKTVKQLEKHVAQLMMEHEKEAE